MTYSISRNINSFPLVLTRLLTVSMFLFASLIAPTVSGNTAYAQTKGGLFKHSAPKGGTAADDGDGDGDGDGSDVDVRFTQVGQQKSCKVVEYRARFDFIAGPTSGGLGSFVEDLRPISFVFREQLTPGLRITEVNVIDAVSSGGGVPVPVRSTTVSENDTVTIEDIKFDLDSIDGDGGSSNIGFEVVITAEIDAAAFPAPITIANQAFLDAAPDIGTFPSHDPTTPEDGNWFTGTPTAVAIDLTGCDEPETPGGGGTPSDEACFKFERGEVRCLGDGHGTFTYAMEVGPESAGRKINLVPLTPGVTVDPAEQIAPEGGGILTWTIHGASAGTTVSFTVLGTEFATGSEEGWALCCRQRIDIEIPEDIPCDDKDPKKPDLAVKKKADVARCKEEGGCKFTITVTNVGDAPYTGEIVLDEVFGPDAARLDAPVPAPWTCVPDTSPMVCKHPSTTLNPGETISLELSFRPDGAPHYSELRNCASISYPGIGIAPFGRLDNDKDCAYIPYCERGDPRCFPEPQKTDLEVEKYAEPDDCTPDGVCNFTIEIRNSGEVPINAPLSITDTYPLGAPTSSTFGPSPPWDCSTTAPDQFVCNSLAPINLPVGAVTTINVTTVVDPDTYGEGQVENCVTLRPIEGEITSDNNKACAIARLPDPQGKPDLTVEKLCTEPNPNGGVNCQLTVINNGTAAPTDDVKIGDVATITGEAVDLPVQAVTPDGPDWTCDPVPASVLECIIPGAALTPGARRSVTATYILIPGSKMRNCLTGLGPDGSLATGPAFASQCVEVAFDEKKDDKQCSSNLIKNDAGRCVCPSGQKYRSGKCVGGASSTPLPLPTPRTDPKLCKRLPGQIRTKDNRCVCRKGSKLNANRTACIKTKPPASNVCKLLPGQIRTQSGKCICPRGESFNQRAGRCVKRQVACPKGTIGKYQPNCERRVVCKRGQKYDRRRNRCITVRVACPKGTIGKYQPNCERRVVCKRGQKYDRRRNRCITVRVACPKGTIGKYQPNCERRVVCKRGQKYDRRRNRCITVRVACPKGTIGKYQPNCQRRVVCKRGQKYDRRRNRCITVRVACPKGTIGKYQPNCKRRVVCKRGQKYDRRRNRCITVRVACPKGTIGKYQPNCKRRVVCKRGQKYDRRRNRCITVRVACPKGTIGKYQPNCKRRIVCKRGQTRRGNRCITIKRPPTQRRCPRGKVLFKGKCVTKLI